MNKTRLWNKIVPQICVEWIESNGVLPLFIPFKILNVCHQICQVSYMWLLWLGLCCINAFQRSKSLIDLQMHNKFTNCLISLFKIPKDNKDFFHKCRHVIETKG